MLWTCVCLSVCLAVCQSVNLSQAGVLSKQLNAGSSKQRRTIAGTLVYWIKSFWWNFNEVANGDAKYTWGMKKLRFATNNLLHPPLDKVQDRRIVNVKIFWSCNVLYRLVTLPMALSDANHPKSSLVARFGSSYLSNGWAIIFKFCTQIISSYYSFRMNDCSQLGVARTTWPIFYSAPQCSHCKRCTSYSISVRLSVCLSRVGIVSKRLHVTRCGLHSQIAKCV